MKKIQLIEEPVMVGMTREETDQTLGGWSCEVYKENFWIIPDDCEEFHETGSCSGGGNYCGKYSG